MTKDFYLFASLLRYVDGGMPQWMVKQIAERLGLMIRFGSSGYVGHYGVYVKSENKRTLGRFARELGVA